MQVLPTIPTDQFPWSRGALSSAAQRLNAFIRALSDPLVGKGVVSIFDQAIVSGTSFATSIMIGRMCSKEQLGSYYLALSLVMLVRGIQEQIVSAPYAVYCHRRKGDALATYTASTLVHHLLLSALAVVCLLSLLGIFSMGVGPAAFAPIVWVLLAAGPFFLLREYIRHLLFARFEMSTVIAIDIAVAVLQLASLVLLSYFQLLSVPLVYAVLGASCAIASFAWFLRKKPTLRFGRAACVADWRHNWSFAKWALATQLVGCTAPYVMPWILTLAHGQTATGTFAACCSLVGLANMFVIGLSNFLTPKAASAFSTGGVHELRRVLWKTAGLFAAPVGAFCLLTFVAGDHLAVFFYGEQYAGAGSVIAILAFSMMANSMSITIGNGLWAMERPAANFSADVCSLVATIAAATLLVPPFGVLGAALATLAGTATGTIVRFVALTRLLTSEYSTPQFA
jgi:O-antigen/teichoic acid export membrane protein